jgi:hypothetical protein
MHALHLVSARAQRAGEDVIGVGADHQTVDRQAHALGHPAGENVAEIPRGHGERDGAARGAQRNGGGEVVDNLRRHAGPVDGIDP